MVTVEEEMVTVEIVNLLKDRIDARISSFTSRRKDNRRDAFFFTIVITLLSAATTIFLGLQVPDKISLILKNFALAFSAIATVFNAWEALFNPKALWVRYTASLSQLKGLRADLDYLIVSSGGSLQLDKQEDKSDKQEDRYKYVLDQKSLARLKKEDLDRLYDRYKSILEETNSSWFQLRKDMVEPKKN